MPDIPLRSAPTGTVLPVLAVPGASRTEIVGPHGNALRVRVAAAPEKGRANEALERLLGDFFGTKATVIAGARSRRKRFLLEGMAEQAAARRIRQEWG